MWPFTKSSPKSSLNAPKTTNTLNPFDSANAPEQKGESPYAALMFNQSSGQVYAYRTLPLESIIRNFESIAPLYTAVTRIANAVASIPITLSDIKTNEDDPTHPVIQLLNAPNPFQQKTKFEYIRDAIIWKLLSGNTYYMTSGLRRRPPTELYLLNPSYIHIESRRDSQGFPDTLRYTPSTAPGSTKPPEEYVRKSPRDPQYYSPDDTQAVYHTHSFNPNYGTADFKGNPETTSLYYEINHWIYASQHNISLLTNGARPSGAFTLKARDGQPAMMSEEQFKRLQLQIQKNYQGSANAGRPLVLEGGLEWQEMQMTPKDLDFALMKERSEHSIYKVLGIPVQLITADSVTANNLSNFRLEFYENRILPLADELCTHLNRFLLPRYPDIANTHAFMVNRDEIDVLIPRRVERRDAIEKSLIMTIDEKRKIFKHPPIKYGNKIVDPNGRPIAGEDVDINDMPVIGSPNPAPAKDTPAETVANPEGKD